MDEEVGQSELPESDITDTPELETESVTGQSEESETESDEGKEPEYDEVEYDGKKYSVPKELKDAFLRQSDYTRKTQEVAEQRRMAEDQIQQARQFQEVTQRNIQAISELNNIDSQLKRFANVDWNAYSDQDPIEAQKSWFQYQQMQQTREQLAGQISAQERNRQIQTQQAIARQLDEGRKVLEREIKGWNTEVAKKLVDYGKTLGYQETELQSVMDPRAVKALHKAYLYDQMISKATQKPDTSVQPKPVTKVGQKSQASKDPSRMSDKEFAVWRKAQISQRN
jgi:hypothetical protein